PGNFARHAIARPGESDFRIARPRRNSKPRSRYSRHEPDALFFAARLRALGQLAVLGRSGYRAEGLSAQSIRAFSAHRDSGRVRIALRIRRLLQALGEDRLHRQSKKK